MKAFAARHFLLRDASYEVRLIYTGFLALASVGMVTMALFQFVHIGINPQFIAEHYRGGESGTEMTFAKTLREMVEVTHFHSFIMGIVYLVLAHLFLATDLSRETKRALIIVGFTGLAGDLILPWGIRFVAASFAWLLPIAWLAEWTAFAAYIIGPIREMWFAPDEEDELPPV